MGFSPGQAVLAMDSLTTATLSRPSASVSRKVRPWTAMWKFSKYPGLAKMTAAEGSSSMRGLLRSESA